MSSDSLGLTAKTYRTRRLSSSPSIPSGFTKVFATNSSLFHRLVLAADNGFGRSQALVDALSGFRLSTHLFCPFAVKNDSVNVDARSGSPLTLQWANHKMRESCFGYSYPGTVLYGVAMADSD
jgi:hypothetical protein